MENAQIDPKTEDEPTARDPGRMDRLAGQTKGLIEDIKEWIDLKVQLIQIELEDKFETVANRILATLLILVLAFVTVIFGLIAAALAIGNVLGDPLWGFLIITGVLAVTTMIVHWVQPKMVSAPWAKKESETSKLTASSTTAQLPDKAGPPYSNSTDGSDTEKK